MALPYLVQEGVATNAQASSSDMQQTEGPAQAGVAFMVTCVSGRVEEFWVSNAPKHSLRKHCYA